jgi:hypothetical protein
MDPTTSKPKGPNYLTHAICCFQSRSLCIFTAARHGLSLKDGGTLELSFGFELKSGILFEVLMITAAGADVSTSGKVSTSGTTIRLALPCLLCPASHTWQLSHKQSFPLTCFYPGSPASSLQAMVPCGDGVSTRTTVHQSDVMSLTDAHRAQARLCTRETPHHDTHNYHASCCVA